MNDAGRRALRTLAQFLVAGGLTAAVDATIVDLDAPWPLYVQAGMTLLVSFSQNWLEDNTSLPALLKAPASDGANPV